MRSRDTAVNENNKNRVHMVSVVEWLRRKIVVLVYAGSNPVRHPITGVVVDSLERDRSSGRGSADGDI